MPEDKILAKGLRFFDKHQSAPDFVIGTLVITPADIYEMCKEQAAHLTDYNEKKQLKLQILKSQAGKMYAVVDTWKKGDAPAKPATPNGKQSSGTRRPVNDLPQDDDLPF